MRLARVVLQNWMCFRGEHVLHLGPKVYGITAQDERDKERSNWLGKTALLEAIRFALTGEHRCRYEDDWITKGEDGGSVVLEFDQGAKCERSRERGKSTQLRFNSAKGDPAQQALYGAMGLARGDFDVAAYFEQRRTARLLAEDPAERTRIVMGWLGMDRLQEADAHNAEEYARAAKEEADARSRVDYLRQALRSTLTEPGDEAKECTVEELKALWVEVEKKVAKLHKKTADLQGKAETARQVRLLLVKKGEYDGIVREGKKLAAEVKATDGDKLRERLKELRQELTEAQGEVFHASRDEQGKRQLAMGKFDGRCPVADIACPAKKEINGQRDKNIAAHDKAKVLSGEKQARSVELGRRVQQLEARLQEWERADTRLQALREQALRYQPDAERASELMDGKEELGDEEALTRELDRVQREVATLQTRGSLLAERIGRATAGQEELGRLEKTLAEHEKRAQTLREAAQILGRNGAQRAVAEEAMAEIEQGANDRLQRAGVDLEAMVCWSSEGKGLARSCSMCGWGYPESAKVKRCMRCGAERGPNIVQRLEFVGSRQSGGADDFLGIALQFAASAWRRREGQVRWATAMLDEPTAQMDAAHRRAFAQMLLHEEAFAQVLVVSHHPATLDALAGRIQITAGPNGSRAEVVA